jgi:predicted metal-dependent phosphotriesterase family hydrolase
MERNRKQQREEPFPIEKTRNHIGTMFIPELRKFGLGESEINRLQLDNPRQLLS